MKTVRIDTTVPCLGSPACPYLVFFNNGDWEFCTAHDVEFLGDYIGAVPVVEILDEISLECLDDEEMDEVDGESIFCMSFEVIPDHRDETVITLNWTGETGLGLRGKMNHEIFETRSPVFNFISLSDFFSDLKYWIKHNRKRMREVEDDHPRDLTDLME